MEFPVVLWVFKLIVVLTASISFVNSFNLTVLHTNDVHSHFEQFNVVGGRCVERVAKEKKCFGGVARQVTKVNELRSTGENVLFLNAGDNYQGTIWYSLYRWQVVAKMVNHLKIDVMSLGNHEFDDGPEGLYPFLENVTSKVVVCNINATKVPKIAEHVRPSVILEVGGQRIGIIGYLTPETKDISKTGDVEFEDEVECIKREAKRLATEEKLNKIFAVGHSGFAVDQNIAREVPEIDIVVGGHTNTFLYSGDPPSVEKIEGKYPTVVTRKDGSSGLVVQAFAYGKYMGHLKVVFNDEGKIISWSGNPILLDASVQEDKETLEILKPYAEGIEKQTRQVVGKTNVLLDGDRKVCRIRECNMGNFLADAALDAFVKQPTKNGWNRVAIALWNAGGIRGSIDERVKGGNITMEDIRTVAPFENKMDSVEIKGKKLKEILEHAVKDYNTIDPPGSFLQVSGLRVIYNISQPVGSRLVQVYANCADCRVPNYQPLEDEKEYGVVMSSYMIQGGDGIEIKHRNIDELDYDIIMKYAAKMKPITTGIEDRITIFAAKNDTRVNPKKKLKLIVKKRKTNF